MTSLKKHPSLVIAISIYLVIASGSLFGQANDDLVKMSQAMIDAGHPFEQLRE